jgi:hypothetical protein
MPGAEASNYRIPKAPAPAACRTGYADFVRKASRRADGRAISASTGDELMARWPRHVWTTIFTYGTVFVLFPLLSFLAYAWVRGWIF